MDPNTGALWPCTKYATDCSFKESGCSDVKFVLEANKLNSLVVLATAYYLTKDELYVEKIELILKGWIKCVPIERSVANRIVMDIAYRCINLINVSVLCLESKVFQERVMPMILGILLHHEEYMWSRYDENNG